MTLGRRGLAVGVSIAVHAAIAAYLFVRPAPKPERNKSQVVSVRVVPRAPARVEHENAGPPSSGSVSSPSRGGAPKRRGVKSTLSEGSVAVEAGGGTKTASIADAGSVSGTGRWDHIDLTLKVDPSGGGGDSGGGGGGESPEGRGPDLKPSGGGTYEHDDTTFRAEIHADGTVDFEDKVIPVPRIGMNDQGQPSIEIPLDLTDTLMRALGDDPYGYEKRKFLAQTQELRAEMAEAACKENLDASLLDIRPRMVAIWENPKFSLAEKKRRLFGLWDECAEEGSADILRTSELIRASILGFIADHLPPNSALAYTSTDLATLNRNRRSNAEFLPYGRSDAGLD